MVQMNNRHRAVDAYTLVLREQASDARRALLASLPRHEVCGCGGAFRARVQSVASRQSQPPHCHYMMSLQRCEIVESNEAGNTTATYVQTAGSKGGSERVDVILPENTKAVWQRVLDVFLPAGYPHSVTNDYLE